MTSTAREAQPEIQLELMTSLLEGADPDAYVVMPIGALVTQVNIALAETLTKDKQHRPGRALVRLVRNLSVLGFIVDTKHPPSGG